MLLQRCRFQQDTRHHGSRVFEVEEDVKAQIEDWCVGRFDSKIEGKRCDVDGIGAGTAEKRQQNEWGTTELTFPKQILCNVRPDVVLGRNVLGQDNPCQASTPDIHLRHASTRQ